MKKILIFQLILLFIIPFILGSSCKTGPLVPASDYIIFGDFHGETAGPNYSTLYKIEDGQIFMDTTHKYPTNSTFYSGEWLKLSNEKMEFVNDSIYNIPTELFENKTGIVGEPDSRDQGGFYLEIFRNAEQSYHLGWLIDKDLNNVPNYLHNYLIILESVIDSLKRNG